MGWISYCGKDIMLHEKSFKCMKGTISIMGSCGIIFELFKIIELMAKSQRGLFQGPESHGCPGWTKRTALPLGWVHMWGKVQKPSWVDTLTTQFLKSLLRNSNIFEHPYKWGFWQQANGKYREILLIYSMIAQWINLNYLC